MTENQYHPLNHKTTSLHISELGNSQYCETTEWQPQIKNNFKGEGLKIMEEFHVYLIIHV